MTLYVAGGVYGHSEKFLFVRPYLTPKEDLPYVSSHPDGSLRNSTKHHSHYYRLDGNELILEKESYEADSVFAIKRVRLLDREVAKIHKSFKLHDYK